MWLISISYDALPQLFLHSSSCQYFTWPKTIRGKWAIYLHCCIVLVPTTRCLQAFQIQIGWRIYFKYVSKTASFFLFNNIKIRKTGHGRNPIHSSPVHFLLDSQQSIVLGVLSFFLFFTLCFHLNSIVAAKGLLESEKTPLWVGDRTSRSSLVQWHLPRASCGTWW